MEKNSFQAKLLAGDRVTLGRAINAVDNDSAEASDVLRAVRDHLGRARVIGITGAPGAGKSTLVNGLIHAFRKAGETVGVVAVDPSSPLTGGAILGDRIRMSEHASDPDVFIRSVASQGHLGGLSRTAVRIIDVMDGSGKGVIIVETVGTGQSEVEVMEIAQSVVVVCAPGLGDEIQAIKAGILEIADILIVNKADSPLANRTEAELKEATILARSDGWQVPILRTIATQGEGIEGMIGALATHYRHLGPSITNLGAQRRSARLVVTAASEYLRERLEALNETEIDKIGRQLIDGKYDLDGAARAALKAALREL